MSTDNDNKKPVQTFREGAIGVSVWRREGKHGPFYEFTISRSYKNSDDEAGYSDSFREQNEVALVQVITDASSYIRQLEADAQIDFPETTEAA